MAFNPRTISLLDAVTVNTTGTGLQVLSTASKYIVQIIGDQTFTCDVEGSLDGVNWHSFTSVTAGGIVEVPYSPYVRARTSGMAGGSTVSVISIAA